MSRKVVDAACFLCGIPTRYEEFDFEKRRHYGCTASNCGEYIVTDTAMERLAAPHADSFKHDVSALIARRDNSSTLVEIWVNPTTHVLETHVVPRKESQAR